MSANIIKINTCGLSCPQPVLLTLQCIKKEQPSRLQVIVDNEASHENVTRAGENNAYTVTDLSNDNGIITLDLIKN